MIDIEIDFYDELARAVLDINDVAYVTNIEVAAPPQFPAVSIIEISNIEDAARNDSSNAENAALVTYEINAYSNSASHGTAECKSILQAVDETMRSRNMQRTYFGPVPNASDPGIYRMVARYVGVIGKDHVHYRR